MKKLYSWFINLPKDKLLHIVAISIVTMLSISLFKLAGCGLLSIAYGWAVVFAVSISKEIYDEVKKKHSAYNSISSNLTTQKENESQI
jgi:hypothetical protein